MALSRKLAKGLILMVGATLSVVLIMGVWRGLQMKERRMVSRAVPQEEVSEAEMKLTDMEYTEMEEGRRRWMIKASEAKYFQEDRKTILTLVSLIFFLDDGKEIHLESQKGVLYAGTKDIELWDSVRATVPNGYQLMTQHASYSHQQGIIFSETPVQVSGPDLQLSGMQWKYVLPQQRAFLEGKVKATLTLGP